MSTLALAHRRARKGARLLDELMPGWQEHVSLDTLEMANPCKCIGGQLFPERIDTPNDWRFRFAAGLDVSVAKLRTHGFDSTSTDDPEFYELELAWMREIVSRRRQ